MLEKIYINKKYTNKYYKYMSHNMHYEEVYVTEMFIDRLGLVPT